MIYGFDTESKDQAMAALLVYVVYRSRNTKRFKVSTKMWEQITGFAKLSAKKSLSLPEFIERFRKPMCCETLQSRYCKVDEQSAHAAKVMTDGSVFVAGEEGKAFLTSLIHEANTKQVLDLLYKETAFIIHAVRERLEAERITDKLDNDNED